MWIGLKASATENLNNYLIKYANYILMYVVIGNVHFFFIPKTSKKVPFVEIRVIFCCHVKDPLENPDKNLRKSSIF